MAVTKMKDHGIKVYPFSELRHNPTNGRELVRKVDALAATMQGDWRQPVSALDHPEVRDLLRDTFDYETFIFTKDLKEVDFGCLFVLEEGDKVVAFLLSFHNHSYANSDKRSGGKKSTFPLNYLHRQVTHDLGFIRELNILGTFAYCYQIGVRPTHRGEEHAHNLLNAFERYYAHCVIKQPEQEPTQESTKVEKRKLRYRRVSFRKIEDFPLDTLIFGASIHESQYRTIRMLVKRSRGMTPLRHQDVQQGANYRAMFLDHQVAQTNEKIESHWYRVVQIPDTPRFLRSLDYKKTRIAARTIIPIQLNQAVHQINELLETLDAKVLWSSFFFDQANSDVRELLPEVSHGFFMSLLELETDKHYGSREKKYSYLEERYYKMLRSLRKVTSYLKEKSSKSAKVVSLTHGFREHPAQIFFFADDPHRLDSFPQPVTVTLKNESTGWRALAPQLRATKNNTARLTKEEQTNCIESLIAFALNSEENAKAAWQNWADRLMVTNTEQRSIEEDLKRYKIPSDVYAALHAGVEGEVSTVLSRLYDRIINQEHFTAAAHKKFKAYFRLHDELYEVDQAAFPKDRDYWWCHAVMPINTSYLDDISGIMFTFRCRKPRDSSTEYKTRLNTVAQAISSALPRDLLNNIIRLQDSNSAELATRYSISAITTRNMAHHLGSHILDNMDSREAVYELMRDVFPDSFAHEMAKFLSFVRTKTHLLADLTSTNPVSSVTSYLNSEVLEGFRDQKIMQLFVSGTHIKNIELKYIGPNGTISDDVLVQMPNGDLGRQAFYMLLTNIIRNVAKYEDTTHEDEIVITVRVVPAAIGYNINTKEDSSTEIDTPRGYGVLIYDNISRSPEKLEALIGQLQNRLETQRSRLGNDIRTSGWGLQEMTAAAAYLRKKGAEHSLRGGFDEVTIPLLRPERVDGKDGDRATQVLGYRIYLKKPRLALVIRKKHDPLTFRSKWHKRHGVRILSEEEALSDDYRNYSHVFVVSTYDKCRENVELQKRFPLRWIKFTGKELDLFNEYLLGDSPQDFTNFLWQEWVEKYSGRKGLDPSTELRLQLKNDTFPAVLREDTHLQSLALIYDHHGTHLPPEIDKDRPAFYQSFGSVSPTGRVVLSRFRSKDKGINSNHEWEEFKLQLTEAAITRVLILDERIQRQASENGNRRYTKAEKKKLGIITQGPQRDHFAILRRMNIHIPTPESGLVLDFGNQERAAVEWLAQELSNPATDFVVLHLGLLESWLGSSMKTIKEWVETNVKQKSKRSQIVLISGRGRPVDFPQNYCYLPASIIAEYTVSGPPSKYHLVQMLFSSRTRLNI